MTVRNYVNGAPLLTLTVAVNSADTILEVGSTAGYPAAPFTMALERGTVNEEVVLCSVVAATTFSVTRGWDGTSAKSHSVGAAIEHTTAAIDYNQSNAHINNTVPNPHPEYVPRSSYGVKGQVLVGTGEGTFAARAAGSAGQILLADPSTATGDRWGNLPSSAVVDGSVTGAKLSDSTRRSLVSRLASAPTGADAPTGRIYFNTSDSRWYGFEGGVWRAIPFGAGRITISSSAPSGGVNGDIWFRF